jgi:hypothetical protein
MAFKEQIIALRQSDPDLKYKEIAARLGCAENTVAQVCSQTGLRAGYRRAEDFSSVLKLGYAAKRVGLTLQQIEEIANARHA